MAQEIGGGNNLQGKAVAWFIATSEDETSGQGLACKALYEAACSELKKERGYAYLSRKEFLLHKLLGRWGDGFAPVRYQVTPFEHGKPAPEVRTNLLLLREPNSNHLGSYGVWLVLARKAQVIPSTQDVCIVLPTNAKITRHHLAWIACINEALGTEGSVRMLEPTWAHTGWKRGFGYGEGYPLADRAPVELEHLVDVVTGERLGLRLSRGGAALDGSSYYLLDLVGEVEACPGEPGLGGILQEWWPIDAALTYGSDGSIEHLELDESAGWLVAKFSGEFNLKVYETWLQAWVVPSAMVRSGESGYDRAYYLGQGCWEDMSAIDGQLAAILLGEGYLGDVMRGNTMRDEWLYVFGPDGAERIVDRATGRLVQTIPSPFRVWEEKTRALGLRARREAYLHKFEGCLVGGAVGDALGYPVEFMSYDSIQEVFGPAGIRSYWLEKTGGTALFSDDTQMTIFTAAGLLEAETAACVENHAGNLESYVNRAYLDWLHTQDEWFYKNPDASYLAYYRPLYTYRAPGNTCLSALHAGGMGSMAEPPNDSMGCGGVMRVAPVGLFAQRWFGDVRKPGVLREVARAGAAAAALTHGHPMGYIPAGVLAALVALVTYCDGLTLDAAVTLCARRLPSWFEDDPDEARDMAAQLRYAAELAADGDAEYDNVVILGEGWVGDEALAIAVYCCLRHPDSFDEAVIAAVNHGGDSDSTGAIAGNIMGAYLGIEGIGTQWTEHLELGDLIFGLARDLCYGCPMVPGGVWREREWIEKYARAYIPLC